MTLDEAIKVEETETLAHEQTLNSLDDNMPNDMREDFEKSIGKHMEYHRQLAEWLRELKAYREARKEINGLATVWEEGEGINKCRRILFKYLEE